MSVSEFFCHNCREGFLLETSKDMFYVYSIHESKNPGGKVPVIEKAISREIYNPKRCPFCRAKSLQKMKGG